MTSPWESWKPPSAIVLTSLKLSVAVTLKRNFSSSSCFSRKTGIQATVGAILSADWNKANGDNELTRPQTRFDVASTDVVTSTQVPPSKWNSLGGGDVNVMPV